MVTSVLQPDLGERLDASRGGHPHGSRIDPVLEPALQLSPGRSLRLVHRADRPHPSVQVTYLRPSEPAPVALLNDLDLAVRAEGDSMLRHGQEAIQAAASRSFCSSHISTADRR